jgi:hypothetical protein
MKPIPGQPRSHHDHLNDTGPAVEDHGRAVSTNRRAAAFYRQAQQAHDARGAITALRRAVNADPAFGLAIADLGAVTATAGKDPRRPQMNWERHHIEVVRTAAAGNAQRAADLLREHVATVGCDPLATRIAAQLRPTGGHDDNVEDLAGLLPGCHATLWPPSPQCPPSGQSS